MTAFFLFWTLLGPPPEAPLVPPYRCPNSKAMAVGFAA